MSSLEKTGMGALLRASIMPGGVHGHIDIKALCCCMHPFAQSFSPEFALMLYNHSAAAEPCESSEMPEARVPSLWMSSALLNTNQLSPLCVLLNLTHLHVP